MFKQILSFLLIIFITFAVEEISYHSIGCYKDTEERAIPNASGFGYDNSDYSNKADAINKCYIFAKLKGNSIFSVQDGGWCATGPNATKTFDMYGNSTACAIDGKGGSWANEVYIIVMNGGCFVDKSNRDISESAGSFGSDAPK